MRERYRKSRRRQQAQFLLLGCGVLGFALIVLLIWRALARPAGETVPQRPVTAAPAPRREAQRDAPMLPAPSPIRVAGEQSFRVAPWLLDTDGTTLFTLTDESPYNEPAAYYNCDLLAASAVRGGKSVWEQRGEFRASQLDYAGGMLITVAESQSDKTISVKGFNAASGVEQWSQVVEAAAQPRLYAGDQQALLTYSAKGGSRIVSFNTANGVKAWGFRPELRGLNRGLAEGEARMQLHVTPRVVVYVMANVVGILDRKSGKPLRSEFSTSGRLLSTVIEEHSSTLFLHILGGQSGTSSIKSVPLGDGAARDLLNVQSADDRVFFVPSPDWLFAAYRQNDGGTVKLVMECKPLLSTAHASAEGFRHELVGGIAACGSLVPGSASFLVGIASDSAEPAAMSGARQFYLVSPEQLSVTEAGRTPEVAFDLLVFHDNVIAICDGGELHRYDVKGRRFRLLKRLRHPQLGMLVSDDRTALLVYSTTEEYMEQQPGEPLQAVVIK